MPTFTPTQPIFAAAILNVRRTPGVAQKPSADVLGQTAFGSQLTITGDAQLLDGLTWWPVRAPLTNGQTVAGWVAEASGGVDLIRTTPPTTAPTPAIPAEVFAIGQQVALVTTDPVNLRRSAGYSGKPSDDVLTILSGDPTLALRNGMQPADELFWWQVSGTTSDNNTVDGWLAEASPAGVRLIAPRAIRQRMGVGKPFIGEFVLSQGWGSNPNFYHQFNYDGVPLKGHNGLDFDMPIGTQLVSIDDGRVLRADYEAGGFGNYVLMAHDWGESIYAHLERIDVRAGQTLAAGQGLGLSGDTGASSAPHLHFAIRILPYRRIDGWGGFANPAPFMNPADLILSRALDFVPSSMAAEVAGLIRP